MKQIWPNYSYSPATNVLTLTGLNIDRDQLLLVTAADRGRIMYNFADSSVTASAFTSGANTALTLVATTAGLTTTAALVIYYDDQLASTTVTVSSMPAISGTVTAVLSGTSYVEIAGGIQNYVFDYTSFPISGTVTVGSALPAGTNRIGVVTIGGGTVTIGAGTAQIGSVTASISGTVPVSGTFWQATQPASLASLPALAAGTNQIGSVTASISGTVPVSGTFWQATQPVSLASVPAHAVTLASTTVTVSSLPALPAGTAQIGSVTASINGTVPVSGTFWQATQPASLASLPALAAGTAQIGSVTASILQNPSGGLATRFGSVTTANTAQITTAVTNTSRKYLLVQNISTTSATIGIGFSPTTTQGIQLSAGSGIVFDSFCPTSAVYWLSATTGDNFVILEG
jgi:hypothetical protein